MTPGSREERQNSKLWQYIAASIIVIILVFWFSQTKEKPESFSETSRLAAIASLVERGTWRIDQSEFNEVTYDKVYLDNHYYSDKPPLFNALGAVVYGVMHNLFDIQLKSAGCLADELCGYKWITFILVGIPSALMIGLMFTGVYNQTFSGGWALFITALFAFGTMVWPYSLVFNNHIPAAACLFACFVILVSLHQSTFLARLKLFLAGLLAGLAVSIDIVTIFIVVPMFIFVLLHYRQTLFLFVLGGFIPAMLTMLFDYQISGSILPPYFATEGYSYPDSPWDNTLAATSLPENAWEYAFRGLIGDRGFLAYSPVLLWSIVGLGAVIKNRRHHFWIGSVLLALGIAAYIYFILTRTSNFGGKAYGARYFIGFLPVLFFFAIYALPQNFGLFRTKLMWVALVIISIVSVMSAYQGVVDPWERIKPIVFLKTQPFTPALTLCSNLTTGCLDALYPCAPVNIGAVPKRFDKPANIQYPLEANFADKIMLLGYDLAKRRITAGEPLALILYWQSLQPMKYDYVQFNHFLDTQLDRYGGYDRIPLNRYATSCWSKGQVVVDGYTLPIDTNTPNGIYNLQTGFYTLKDNKTVYLELVQENKPTGVTNITIGPILVGDPPKGVVVPDPQIENIVDVELGNIILLKGYNLSYSDHALQLKLYWQSIAKTKVDYTAFIHVLNQENTIVAQVDHLPANGAYPTSLWSPREIILDEFVVPLPDRQTSGVYSIVAGLYDFKTGTRLDVETSPQDTIHLATVEAKLP